jgi:hypothetical protein
MRRNYFDRKSFRLGLFPTQMCKNPQIFYVQVHFTGDGVYEVVSFFYIFRESMFRAIEVITFSVCFQMIVLLLKVYIESTFAFAE